MENIDNNQKLTMLSLNVNNFGGIQTKPAKNFLKNEEWNNPVHQMIVAKKILKYIKKTNAQICIFQEFDSGSIAGENLLNLFPSFGFQIIKEDYKGSIVIVIYKTDTFKKDVGFKSKKGCLSAYARWTEVDFEIKINNKKLKIVGLHIPLNSNKRNSEQRKEFKMELKKQFDRPAIIIGDFNAATNDDRAKPCRNDDVLKENIDLLNIPNFIDIWRLNNNNLKEYTWYFKGNKNDGRRLDYAFVSEDLIESCDAKYVQSEKMDEGGKPLSDHAALILEIDICKL